jgi:hypothetical protein
MLAGYSVAVPAEALVQCESISQTEVTSRPAWLAVAAPPDAGGIEPVLYARLRGSWAECQQGSICNGVVFPKIEHKLVEPEKYHFFYLRPSAQSSGGGVVFSSIAHARLGVRYQSAAPKCTAMQIIEVGPKDFLQTKLLVPSGVQFSGYSWSRKANSLPPTPPPPAWEDCSNGTCKGFPILLVAPFKDSGGDGASGFDLNCSNRTFGNPSQAELIAAKACLVQIPYVP